MNANELKNLIRDEASKKIIAQNPELLMVDGKPYTFALPIETAEGTAYARIGITSMRMEDTKVSAGFNPETDASPAEAAFQNMLEERAANEAAKAANKAKKSKKKKDEDEE